MATHNCSRCKVDQGPFGVRHKRHGYLICDSCLARELWVAPVRWSLFGFVRRAARWLLSSVGLGFSPERTQASQRDTFNAKTRARMASAQFKARSIPLNPAAMVPQKR